jgi:signal transduction histidine kinase
MGVLHTMSAATRDVVLAACAAAAVLVAALLEGAPAAAALPLSVAVAAPLLVRRRFPVSAALASAVVALAGAGIPEWSGRLVALAAFCSAAYHARRPVLLLNLSIGWTAALLLVANRVSGAGTVAEAVVMGIAPVAGGYALRLSREHARQSARLHEVEAARQIAEENGRVARDVHDAVGHHLTAIRMQAGAARHVLRGDDVPPVAGTALATIDGLAAAALTDVRCLLHDLRAAPTLAGRAGARALAQRLTTAECPIGVTDDDPDVRLPAAVARAGYRVLQEAVTNAVRHAGATRIDIRIGRAPRELTVTVTDDGTAGPPEYATAGHGLRGMRERIDALGGTLRIDAREPHGWMVVAVLPVAEAGA